MASSYHPCTTKGTRSDEATYHFKQLIDRGKPFFSLNAIFELVLFPFLVPALEFLIVLAKEMSANLMMKHSHNSSLPIFNRQPYIYLGLTSLWIVSHASWSHFVLAKIQHDLVSYSQRFQIVHEVLLCFFLSDYISFSAQVISFGAVDLKKAIQNVFCYLHVFVIRLLKLTEIFCRQSRIFIVEYRINLALTLKKFLLFFLQILWH